MRVLSVRCLCVWMCIFVCLFACLCVYLYVVCEWVLAVCVCVCVFVCALSVRVSMCVCLCLRLAVLLFVFVLASEGVFVVERFSDQMGTKYGKRRHFVLRHDSQYFKKGFFFK